MHNKQVGITKPLMVVSDLLTFITGDDPHLQFKLNFVNMLYGKIREQLKAGKIKNIDDVKQAIELLPPFMKTKITDKRVIQEEELDTIYDRIVKHSQLIMMQNERKDQNISIKSHDVIKLEEELSYESIFTVNVEDDQLSHAGTFSIISVLPFIHSLDTDHKELLLQYLNHMPETIAVMKLMNTRIISQIDETLTVEDITTFGQPSFLAMATTATTKNTDTVSLLADLVTTAVILNNDPNLKLGLDKREISYLSVIVENESMRVPNFENGKEIFKRIIEDRIQKSSSDDKEFYSEYLIALRHATMTVQYVDTRALINKIINVVEHLDIETKNLLINLTDTAEIIKKIDINMQTEDYLHHSLNTQNDSSITRELVDSSTSMSLTEHAQRSNLTGISAVYLNSENQSAFSNEDQNNASLSPRAESSLLGEETGDVV